MMKKNNPTLKMTKVKPFLDNDQKCQKLTPYPKSTENDHNGQSVDSVSIQSEYGIQYKLNT